VSQVKLPLEPQKNRPQNIKWYRQVAKNTQIAPQTTSSVANSKPIPPTVAYKPELLINKYGKEIKPILTTNIKYSILQKYVNKTHQVERAKNNVPKLQSQINSTPFYKFLLKQKLQKQLSKQTQQMTNNQYQLAKWKSMIDEPHN